MIIVLIIGLSIASLLLLAGYLFGIKQGQRAREMLRGQLFDQKDFKIDTLLQQSDALQRVIEPLSDWDTQVKKLNSSIQKMQASIVNKDQVALELSNLKTSSNRGDLSNLMDEIAEKADFESVILCNENGLPLVSSKNTEDLERLAAIASFVVIFGDRMSRNNSPSPISFLVRDSSKKDILCRIFHVGKQRLIMTAVSTNQKLTPNALDPTLEKVVSMLTAR